nr:ribonuclease H-like domain-containing protein [Tanacetum cinerariifolium]
MYNVTLGWIIESGANQHMSDSTKDMFNVVDISSLMLTVSHSNDTLAKITAIGFESRQNYGIGSESGGLYFFDINKIGKFRSKTKKEDEMLELGLLDVVIAVMALVTALATALAISEESTLLAFT